MTTSDNTGSDRAGDDRATLPGALTGRLIVSAQAPAGHALRDSQVLARLAAAAEQGGAAAIRCGGVGGIADIEAVLAAVTVPVIGLTKEGSQGVYITPTADAVRRVAATGAQIVAFDATARERPDGSTVAGLIELAHDLGALTMADVATAEEGIAAAQAGADIVSTTLAGYTPDTAAVAASGQPDLALISRLRELLDRDGPGRVLLCAEGRYHSPEQARSALTRGADTVVVGTAITDIAWVTARYAKAVASGR